MELKGAEIRNILQMCMEIGSNTVLPLRVNIPYYQRPYRWDKKRIDNLINDFYKNKIENENTEYFVGSVVLVKDDSTPNKYDVIDGQQRITTIFLLNYLRFVIQRSYIEEKISIKAPNIDSLLQEFENIYSDLFGSEHTQKFKRMHSEIIEKMESIYELDDSEREQAFKEISDLYRETVYLPEREFTDFDKYLASYEENQKSFLSADKLALTYSRVTFNKTLIKALAKICVVVSKDADPRLCVIDISEQTDRNILQYTNAIQYEFDALCRICFKGISGVDDRDKKQMQSTKTLLAFINELIENVKFCVIMTGNERDAYTLFEVLNDRAMEIDDLELIKNLFLKAYCKTSGDADNLIDANIGELDQIWGDEIFNSDLSEAHRKLISYLGTLYLTADEKAFTNKLERYREIIEKDYLKEYNGSSLKYSYRQVFNDIKVYQMIRIIIEEYNLPARNNRGIACLRAENDLNVSITYKTFHLLNALKLDGVMPALTNIIIKQYMISNNITENNKKIDISDFKTYINKVKNDYQHVNPAYKEIHELAFKLWKAVLLSKNYEIPREIARKTLKNISRKTWNPSDISISLETNTNMMSQFKEWITNWRYGSAADLKVKVLFINLFKADKSETKLVFGSAATYSFKEPEKIQLDHMEAQKPNISNKEKHFYPSDDHESREKYTDALGNSMILDSDNNNNKDNKPLEDAMVYYENMCPNHWLNKEAQNILNNHNNTVIINEKPFKVPNEKFFNERASRLINYFEKILQKNLDDNEISIT